MATARSTQAIEDLWQNFKTSDPSGGEEITLEGLRNVMQSLGHQPTDEELRHMLFDVDATGSVTFEKFVALAASLLSSSSGRDCIL